MVFSLCFCLWITNKSRWVRTNNDISEHSYIRTFRCFWLTPWRGGWRWVSPKHGSSLMEPKYGPQIWTPCNFLFSIFLFFKTVWGNDSLMGKWLLNGGSQDSMRFIGTTPVPSFVHFSLLSRSLVTHFLISNSISRQRLSCLGSAPILASSRLKVAYFCEGILPF